MSKIFYRTDYVLDPSDFTTEEEYEKAESEHRELIHKYFNEIKAIEKELRENGEID